MNKIFGNLTLRTIVAPKRGMCLEASCNNESILMDFCGMNPMLVPDGTNAYFFGNKLILVTRWSDMNDEEKQSVENGDLILAIHPYDCLQFSLCVDGNWGDVMVNLHHCYSRLNNENAPVDEVIFVFADTHDSDYLISRSAKLPMSLQNFLMVGNKRSYAKIALDDEIENLRAKAEQSPNQDLSDLLYDACWEKTKMYSRKARQYEPNNVPMGIYVEINSSNEITKVYQYEEEKTEQVSEEVKMYLTLAEKGISEGQYNLGVCYEQGDGVKKDYKKAVYWYKKAADQNHAKAQYNLGVCYYNGCGVEVDKKEAARLFLLSAEQDDMYAQFNIGVCYYNGQGVQQNVIKAMEWLRKAADQGHPEAKKLFG